MRYNRRKEQRLKEMLTQLVQILERHEQEIVELAELKTWLAKEACELVGARTELSLEPAQFCLDKTEVMMARKEQDREDMMDKALQVESIRCITDVPTKELTSSQNPKEKMW